MQTDLLIVDADVDYDVSVIIPHFNAPEFCCEAVQSIASKHHRCEVLIVDDGSSELAYQKLIDILKSGEFTIDRLRIIRTNNQGAYKARLYAAKLVLGQYLKFLDQDDVLIANVLADEIQHAQDKKADVVMTDWQEVWLQDDLVSHDKDKFKQHIAPEYAEDRVNDFLSKGGVFTSAALYRSSLFKNMAVVSDWLPKLSDDWVIFGQVLLNANRYATLHTSSYQWRHHPKQLSANTPLGHAREFYHFLSWFEKQTRANGLFRQEHKPVFAQYYTKNAIFLCWQDREWWKNISTKIKTLDSNLNSSPHFGKVLNMSVCLLGFNYGVRFYVLIKRCLNKRFYN